MSGTSLYFPTRHNQNFWKIMKKWTVDKDKDKDAMKIYTTF